MADLLVHLFESCGNLLNLFSNTVDFVMDGFDGRHVLAHVLEGIDPSFALPETLVHAVEEVWPFVS